MSSIKSKLRIIRLKQVLQIAKHAMWREALPKETIDKMMAVPHIESVLYAWYVTGDSYVFHSKDSPVYWCVSRGYLVENYPDFIKYVEKENDPQELN